MSRTQLYVALVLILTASMADAQLSRGSLTGVVTDSTAAVIPNVKVIVTNPNNGATWQTVTNGNGQYSIPNLQTGAYELTFEAPAFKKLVRSGIDLSATEVLRIDATLEVGAVTDSVQITAESPRLQTETPEVGTPLINSELGALPLSFSGARLAENFAYKITPGVAGNSWTSNINGSTSFSKETLLDGATVTTYLSGHFGESSVSVEALQEFKIQTAGMSAA